MLASLAAVALLLGGGRAVAQQGWRPAGTSAPASTPAPAPATTLTFSKSAPDSLPPALSFTKPATATPAVHDSSLAPPSFRRIAYQPKGPAGGPAGQAAPDEPIARIQLEPPGPDRVFRLESEEKLHERMRQEARDLRNPPVVFPEEPVVSPGPYPGRHWPPTLRPVEPFYVCYKNLYFQQRNFERYGWDLGIFQPIVSTGIFFADVVALPYHIGSSLCGRCCDCSAGECLPGSPVPLRLYPPEMSAAGAVAETGAVLALIAIFP